MSTMLHRLSLLLAIFSYSSAVLSASIPHDDHHDEPVRRSLPSAWYQRDDHPVHELFKRDVTGDGVTYAQVGSPEWAAGFPSGKPDPSKLPQAWVDALNNAISAGLIPNIPVSNPNGGMPTYGGLNPSGPEVCSTTYQCRNNNDLWDAPNGTFGVSFDDGPLPGTSDTLYAFLKQNNVKATHFFIGENILYNPKEFLTAFQDNEDDIAVHTWTHPYMTTLSNQDVLGELGWTMYIIHNSTGGRIPKYWRPPYGDSDNRVSAIAQHVFGLRTVIWNQDTADWSIGQPGGTTPAAVQANMKKWLTGPKSPGLIVLEHELSKDTVNGFINAFPMIQQNGWKTVSVAQLDGGSGYQNADGDEGTVVPVNGIIYNSTAPPTSTASSSTPSATGSNSTSSTNGTTTGAPGGPGSKQANITDSSPSPSGTSKQQQQQQSGAAAAVGVGAFWNVRGMLAACLTVFVSAVALA